jgi:hypothetical protein
MVDFHELYFIGFIAAFSLGFLVWGFYRMFGHAVPPARSKYKAGPDITWKLLQPDWDLRQAGITAAVLTAYDNLGGIQLSCPELTSIVYPQKRGGARQFRASR